MSDIDSSVGFDPARLDAYLRRVIDGAQGTMTIQRIGGGQSNPTFFVDYPERRLVLRKRPPGPLLPSAHAIDREYRIMTALAGSRVPVPRMLVYHAEADLIGTAFYVMERVEGRVFADCTLPGVSPAERRAMILAMAEMLAILHRLDWRSLHLADYGREGCYFERQIARWSKQWSMSKTREIPEIERLMQWLPANLPADDVTTIAHGDFRIGNLMFHPTEPHVVAVLDWELATLGHPLADLAYSALAWKLNSNEYMGMRDRDLATLGLPTEREYLDTYHALTPEFGRLGPFHTAFALFRLAVIFEGIANRACSDAASGDNAAEVGWLGAAFAHRAIEAIESGTA